jgi:hypothetical protein
VKIFLKNRKKLCKAIKHDCIAFIEVLLNVKIDNTSGNEMKIQNAFLNWPAVGK